MTKTDKTYLNKLKRDIVTHFMHSKFYGVSYEDNLTAASWKELLEKSLDRCIHNYERGLMTRDETVSFMFAHMKDCFDAMNGTGPYVGMIDY